MKITKKTIYNVDDFGLMFNPIEDSIDIKKVKDGYKVKYLSHDEECECDPRKDSNLTRMVCFHSKYTLGDKHDYKRNDYQSWGELKAAIEKEKVATISPLYLYDHSGITISTGPFSCPWDSGQVGFIYITKADLKKEGVTKKKAEEIMKCEVETYDMYIKGEVYMAVGENFDKDKNNIDYDTLGGILGYEYALKDLKSQM